MSVYKSHSGYPSAPGYKREGTSEDAASGIAPKVGSLRAKVYDQIKFAPSTPEEVADVLSLPVHSIRPRFSELSARGLIKDSGKRRTAMGGRLAMVWEIT